MTIELPDDDPDEWPDMDERIPVEADVRSDVDPLVTCQSGPDEFPSRDVYLTARSRADGDPAYVPHDVLVSVAEGHGRGDAVSALKTRSDWLVWTPKTRDTPLYAYTPDVAGDTSDERDQFTDLLDAAGVGTDRFINVHDAQKGSFDTANNRSHDDRKISGNYGVKGGRGGDETGRWLVDIDVDDYGDTTDNPHIEQLRGETLAVASAHTTTETPGHLYVAVTGDPREVVRDVVGRDVTNPAASFGEIRVDEQYCVGPGSEIVCGCEMCETSEYDGYGRYEFAAEVPPIVWSVDEFKEFLESDETVRSTETGSDGDDSTGRSSPVTSEIDGIVEFAETVDETVEDALNYGVPSDRSKADAKIAWALAPWLNFDRSAVKSQLDEHGTSKWDERGESYRQSVLTAVPERDRTMDSDGYAGDVPHWAVVEFAVETGIVSLGDTEVVEGDSGGEYRKLSNGDAYRKSLTRIEGFGVDHGWDWDDDGNGDGDAESLYRGHLVEHAPDGVSPLLDDRAMLEACLRARDAGAVPGDADPPDAALHPIIRDCWDSDPESEAVDDGLWDMARDVYHGTDADRVRERFIGGINGGDGQ